MGSEKIQGTKAKSIQAYIQQNEHVVYKSKFRIMISQK